MTVDNLYPERVSNPPRKKLLNCFFFLFGVGFFRFFPRLLFFLRPRVFVLVILINATFRSFIRTILFLFNFYYIRTTMMNFNAGFGPTQFYQFMASASAFNFFHFIFSITISIYSSAVFAFTFSNSYFKTFLSSSK